MSQTSHKGGCLFGVAVIVLLGVLFVAAYAFAAN